MSNDLIMSALPKSNMFTTEFRGVRYEYYLTGNIGEPEEYLEMCNTLRTAGPQDEIMIRINSGGGFVHTGNMIINAIEESEASVIGFIESNCGSVATYIFLACSGWGISSSAEFFAHTCSSGNFGKENETFEHAAFLRKQTHKMIRSRYNQFLTPDEIEGVILGSDVYLDSDQIAERLEVYAEFKQSACDNPDCNTCCSNEEGIQAEATLEEFDFDDMIASAVEKGIILAMDKVYKKYDLVEKVKKPNSKTKKVMDDTDKGVSLTAHASTTELFKALKI